VHRTQPWPSGQHEDRAGRLRDQALGRIDDVARDHGDGAPAMYDARAGEEFAV